MAKLDVVINCYNDAEIFHDALNSVLAQESGELIGKIIVMDDGSSDNTEERVKAFSDPRITYVYQENRGLAAARNRAVMEVTAPYVAFIDSDDIWCKDKTVQQMRHLENQPEVDMIYTNVYGFYGDWPPKSFEKFRCRSYNGRGHLNDYFVYDAPVFPSTVIIKTETYRKLGGFDEEYRKSEDTEFWLRIFSECSIAHIDGYLVYRRLSETSLGADLEVLLPYQRSMEEKICKDHPELSPLIPKRHAYQYFVSAKEKITKFGQIKKGRTFLIKNLKVFPFNIEAWGLLIFSYIPILSNRKTANRIKIFYKKISGKYR